MSKDSPLPFDPSIVAVEPDQKIKITKAMQQVLDAGEAFAQSQREISAPE